MDNYHIINSLHIIYKDKLYINLSIYLSIYPSIYQSIYLPCLTLPYLTLPYLALLRLSTCIHSPSIRYTGPLYRYANQCVYIYIYQSISGYAQSTIGSKLYLVNRLYEIVYDQWLKLTIFIKPKINESIIISSINHWFKIISAVNQSISSIWL